MISGSSTPSLTCLVYAAWPARGKWEWDAEGVIFAYLYLALLWICTVIQCIVRQTESFQFLVTSFQHSSRQHDIIWEKRMCWLSSWHLPAKCVWRAEANILIPPPDKEDPFIPWEIIFYHLFITSSYATRRWKVEGGEGRVVAEVNKKKRVGKPINEANRIL